MTVTNPANLWQTLNSRYNRQSDIMRPEVRDEQNNLGYQDFESVS